MSVLKFPENLFSQILQLKYASPIIFRIAGVNTRKMMVETLKDKIKKGTMANFFKKKPFTRAN